MSRLSLYLLGLPRIERDDVPVEVDTRKAIALIAYLAMTRESQSRDALSTLLWPEYDQTRGRAALRRTLSALRKALDGEWLEADRESIGLNRGADVWLDVQQFHDRLAECRSHNHPVSDVCAACLAPLQEAASLYRDDFLSGFTLRDSTNFDDWQFFETESLRRELAGTLERLVHGHVLQGEFEAAIPHARRLLALDPFAGSRPPGTDAIIRLGRQAQRRPAPISRVCTSPGKRVGRGKRSFDQAASAPFHCQEGSGYLLSSSNLCRPT